MVEQLLPEGWQAKARELGAFKRGRIIESASTLLRVMLIHLTGGLGLRDTAVQAREGGIVDVSDVALLKRLRNCANWFEWIAQQLRQTGLPPPLQANVASCWNDHRIRLIDGSLVSEPGPTGSTWRLHYAIDFPSLRADEVIVSTRKEGETLKQFTFKAGEIAVADRGFANPPGVAHVHQSGAHLIVRMNLVTLPLYHESGERLDVLSTVKTLQVGHCAAWDIHVKHGPHHIAGRLCAVKKDAASANKARARARRESQRNGTKLQPQTTEAADYVFVFTTLDKQYPVEQIMELYRARWQIELVFKRLKSLAQLGHLKKHDPRAARAWLQGKLLGALLIEALLAQAEHFSPWGYHKLAQDQRALPVA